MKGKAMVGIGMASCNLGVEGAKVVAKLAAVSKSLTSIDLRGNNLGSVGGRAIAQGVSVSKSLTSIDLSGNALCGVIIQGLEEYTAEGITAIAEANSVSGSLTSINLQANNIGGYFPPNAEGPNDFIGHRHSGRSSSHCIRPARQQLADEHGVSVSTCLT